MMRKRMRGPNRELRINESQWLSDLQNSSKKQTVDSFLNGDFMDESDEDLDDEEVCNLPSISNLPLTS